MSIFFSLRNKFQLCVFLIAIISNSKFDDFLNVDNEFKTFGSISDEGIVARINLENVDEEKEEMDQTHPEMI